MVIALGLASRKYAVLLPAIIGEYAGDTLYALMAYCGIGLLKPDYTILKVAALALIYSYLIEISQLYHAPWLDSLRHIKLGGLILGYTFLWSDIICYTIGVIIGLVLELIFYSSIKKDK